MNAYELELYKIAKARGDSITRQLADIVSQQADRIAELEKAFVQARVANFIEGEYGQTITLAELRKTELYHNVRKQITKPSYQEVSSKPVAWFEQDENMKSVWYQSDESNKNAIPLYTHPHKELSDEEISKLWKQSQEDSAGISLGFTTQQHYFASLIIKASRGEE
jgi:hypothetical protein